MDRLKAPQLAPSRETKTRRLSLPAVHVPSSIEMRQFAAQFSKREWTELCDEKGFMSAIDKDLHEAGSIASSMLKRFVYVWV